MSILSGSLWTLTGQVAPTLAGILLIPGTIAKLGTERFGLLSLAWMLIGYFALFDLGLTRAITQLVASQGDGASVRRRLAVANTLLIFLGVIGGVGVAAGSPWLVRHVFRVSDGLYEEALRSLWVLGIALPITLLTASYRSIAEGKLAFLALNIIRTPLGVANFLVPWWIARVSPRLDLVVLGLMGVRVIGLIAHAWLIRRLVGRIGVTLHHLWKEGKSLLGYGGWITISNLISPLMTTFDRFVIGAMLSMTAVAYYVTPYEAISKMWIVAGAVGSVIFPHFSKAQHAAELKDGFRRALRLIGGILGPCTLVVLVFARPLLQIWISPEFAQKSALVAQVLSVSVLINSLALVPFSLIQGRGRPDITAKLHMLEFPIYAALLVGLIIPFGIVGAAIAYGLRVIIDAGLLFTYSRRLLPS